MPLIALALIVGIAIGIDVILLNSSTGKRSDPIFHEVTGVVLVNGEPAKNVHVAFHPLLPKENVFCPVGRTDDAGRFRLVTTSGSKGAPQGEYGVTFFWPDPSVEIDECECTDPIVHDRFRGLYAAAEDSGYQAVVRNSNNSCRFSLWRPRSDDRVPRKNENDRQP